MNLNNFTIKSQDVVQKAQEIAMASQHQGLDTSHLLKALLTEDENVTPYLLKKLEVDPVKVGKRVDEILQRMPRVSGGEQYLTNDAAQDALQMLSGG